MRILGIELDSTVTQIDSKLLHHTLGIFAAYIFQVL